MKKAEEYLKENDDGLIQRNVFNFQIGSWVKAVSKDVAIKAIRRAQEDAIRETVKECAKSVSMNLHNQIDGEFKSVKVGKTFSINDNTYVEIDMESVPKVADKLIKEL